MGLWASLNKRRTLPRWVGPATVVVLAMILIGGFGLRAASRNLPAPKFTLTRDGLVSPVDYPAWRRASDWLAQRKYLVLTFDDGPHGDGVDRKILSVLDKHQAHAVFFVVCAHITAATRGVPQRILDGGNLLGSHSFDHEHLPTLDAAALDHQIDGCSDRLEALTGQRPALFRPPWGQIKARGRQAVRAAGAQVMLWDVNSGDAWLNAPAAVIRMSVQDATFGGSVLLMHSRPVTADALDDLLTQLEQRGYRFVLPTIEDDGHGVG